MKYLILVLIIVSGCATTKNQTQRMNDEDSIRQWSSIADLSDRIELLEKSEKIRRDAQIEHDLDVESNKSTSKSTFDRKKFNERIKKQLQKAHDYVDKHYAETEDIHSILFRLKEIIDIKDIVNGE